MAREFDYEKYIEARDMLAEMKTDEVNDEKSEKEDES